MPYEWVSWPESRRDLSFEAAPEKSGASSIQADPLAELHLWPYRSLPRKGFVIVIAGLAALLAVPLLAVLGTPVLWGLLPFAAATVAALWWALARSYRDGEATEVLRLWPDRVVLVRQARGRRQSWEANPHWVRVRLHAEGGPLPNYLTLKGAGREVEIGAFLSEAERVALAADLERLLG